MSVDRPFTGMETRWLGRVPYAEGLQIQETLVETRRAGACPDTALFLEHEPVYTIGRRRDQSSLREVAALPHEVFETNRGGEATYHGPGQLVGYFINDLTKKTKDLHLHLRAIEDLLIGAVNAGGVPATRRAGLTGVWVEDRKVASIGVGVRRWVTMHGFAINVTHESVSGFSPIVPCGIQGVTMTCLEAEGLAHSVESFAQLLGAEIRRD